MTWRLDQQFFRVILSQAWLLRDVQAVPPGQRAFEQ
jgi:hypothetical protein